MVTIKCPFCKRTFTPNVDITRERFQRHVRDCNPSGAQKLRARIERSRNYIEQ